MFLADLSVTCGQRQVVLQFVPGWRLTLGPLRQQAFCFVSTGVQALGLRNQLVPVFFFYAGRKPTNVPSKSQDSVHSIKSFTRVTGVYDVGL